MLLSTAAIVAGCSDPNALPSATETNFEQTVILAATSGGPLQSPNAFSIAEHRGVRSWESLTFDFIYEVRPDSQRAFLTLGVLGLLSEGALKPGFLPSHQPFDSLTIAEQNGYITDDTVFLHKGDVFMIRSQAVCTSLGLPQYGKIEVADTSATTITLRVLTNNNCGYRGLVPGIPTR